MFTRLSLINWADHDPTWDANWPYVLSQYSSKVKPELISIVNYLWHLFYPFEPHLSPSNIHTGSNCSRPYTIAHLKKIHSFIYLTCPLPPTFLCQQISNLSYQCHCDIFTNPATFPATMKGPFVIPHHLVHVLLWHLSHHVIIFLLYTCVFQTKRWIPQYRYCVSFHLFCLNTWIMLNYQPCSCERLKKWNGPAVGLFLMSGKHDGQHIIEE